MPYDLRQTCARTRGRSGREVSGQYRVTVPDPDVLDRLRMQNHVYDRTLMPRDRFTGSVPIGVRSLLGSSRESSTETNGYGRGDENYAQGHGKRMCREGLGTLRLQGVSSRYQLPLAHCQVQEGRARVEGH